MIRNPMIGHARKVITVCLLLSALIGVTVFAQQRATTKAQKAQPMAAEPARVSATKAVETSPVMEPVAPALKLFKHTTSQGKTCCAQCIEIGSNGACNAWAQCASGVTDCPNWN
ncbi:MAG: hypothetical protein E6Q88_14345 [Lysobacteraceae bacterium]|nr:MAG: hypothetical protein E6Q88_14345 [Xanthomonadaceae bacterium]